MSGDGETCLRCGAVYEPGQTVCFKCGAPIGETRASTQPVPAVKVPRAEERGQPALATAGTAAGVATTPAAVPTSIAAPTVPRVPRARRSGIIVVLVCILVLAAGGGAAYVVRGLTAAPPVASTSVYHDPRHQFSFQRPALWLVTAASDGVAMTDSSGASTAQVSVAAPQAGETAQSHAQSLAARLGLSGASVQQIAGEQWEQRSGQVTGADGAVRQVAVYVTLHAGELYTIQCSSPIASYESTNNLVFAPMLASFTFS